MKQIKIYKRSIFIFRRDFRLDDNIGLINALDRSEEVIPIFIFTPEQIEKNSYRSDNAIKFMLESLHDLEGQLEKYNSKINYLFGRPAKVLQEILDKNKIDAVFVNADYSPYAKERDLEIALTCKKIGIDFVSCKDILLQEPGRVLTGSGKPFVKYTPFFNKASMVKVNEPEKNNCKNYASQKTKIESKFLLPGNLDLNIGLSRKKLPKSLKNIFTKDFEFSKNIAVNGGRSNALKILKKIENFADYDKKRNFLNYKTTELSAYIKFGCVSVRQVYYAFLKTGSIDLIRQLYWRDFYYNILYFYPHVLGHAMKKNYDKIVWSKNKNMLKNWQEGKTGFPVVDACMRELNQTGFMHNRGRLITSSFLVKILQIDWREGEKYFAKKLIDYDVAVNNGNWQWSAGTGADSQPYFRIFNPWTQSKNFDPGCEYIKKFLPELKSVKPADIHNWGKKYKEYKNIKYPAPILSYEKARKEVVSRYKKYLY